MLILRSTCEQIHAIGELKILSLPKRFAKTHNAWPAMKGESTVAHRNQQSLKARSFDAWSF